MRNRPTTRGRYMDGGTLRLTSTRYETDIDWAAQPEPVLLRPGVRRDGEFAILWRCDENRIVLLATCQSLSAVHGYARTKVKADERDDFRVWRRSYGWPNQIFPLEV